MENTLLVMRNEIWKTLRSASYILFAFVLPVVAVLILMVVNLIRDRDSQDGAAPIATAQPQVELDIEGYVDQAGLIREIPEEIPAGHLLAFDTEMEAVEALRSGQLAAYYLVPADYLETGIVYYVYPDDRSYLDDGQQWVMSRTLMLNLLQGNTELADLVWNPAWNVELKQLAPPAGIQDGEDCSRPGAKCESNELVRLVPSVLVALFFVAFMASSSMLFNSIGAERENRVIEVLLLSVSPRELLTGKTLGLGIVSLLQTAVWLGAIYISFTLGKSTLSLPANFSFPAGIVSWSLIFFLGGYALYASLMAGAGAMVPKMKEAGVANFIALFPLLFGYVFGLIAPLAEKTNAPFLVFLSFFPLTSPVVMVMRLADSLVPIWQLLLSAALTYITAFLALRAVASMFHASTLLSGESFSLKRYLLALIGRS